MSSEKIRPEHLARTAFVYVRQSTLAQVRSITRVGVGSMSSPPMRGAWGGRTSW
jgi:hypothetical protein